MKAECQVHYHKKETRSFNGGGGIDPIPNLNNDIINLALLQQVMMDGKFYSPSLDKLPKSNTMNPYLVSKSLNQRLPTVTLTSVFRKIPNILKCVANQPPPIKFPGTKMYLFEVGQKYPRISILVFQFSEAAYIKISITTADKKCLHLRWRLTETISENKIDYYQDQDNSSTIFFTCTHAKFEASTPSFPDNIIALQEESQIPLDRVNLNDLFQSVATIEKRVIISSSDVLITKQIFPIVLGQMTNSLSPVIDTSIVPSDSEKIADMLSELADMFRENRADLTASRRLREEQQNQGQVAGTPKFNKTLERIQIGNRNCIIYRRHGSNAKFIRSNKQFVPLPKRRS